MDSNQILITRHTNTWVYTLDIKPLSSNLIKHGSKGMDTLEVTMLRYFKKGGRMFLYLDTCIFTHTKRRITNVEKSHIV